MPKVSSIKYHLTIQNQRKTSCHKQDDFHITQYNGYNHLIYKGIRSYQRRLFSVGTWSDGNKEGFPLPTVTHNNKTLTLGQRLSCAKMPRIALVARVTFTLAFFTRSVHSASYSLAGTWIDIYASNYTYSNGRTGLVRLC